MQEDRIDSLLEEVRLEILGSNNDTSKDDILTLNLAKARDAVNDRKIKYAADFDKGIFSYVPEESNALEGEGSEELAKEFEEDVF